MFSTVTDRGIDLRDNMCRSIILMKYPLPNISDVVLRVMRDSLGEGRFWKYVNDMADRGMVQQFGRAVRNDKDWCEAWVLDSKVLTKLPRLWHGRYSLVNVNNNEIIKMEV